MGRKFYLPLILLAATGYPSIPVLSQSLAADLPQESSARFELFHDYLIVLQGRVGPLRGLNFLLDTGANPSVLDRHLAAKLHLASVPTEIAVLQGTTRGAMSLLPNLQVGPVTRSNFPVLVEDLGFIQKVVPVRLDGIIGLDVLGQTPFVIDYASHVIHFGSANLPSSVPLQINQGLAMLAARVNDRPVELLLDTGAPSLILFRAPAPAEAQTRLVSSGSIGDHNDQVLHLSSLTLGPAMIRRPSALLVSTQADAGHSFAGILSPAGLGFRQIGIDLRRGELRFSMEP